MVSLRICGPKLSLCGALLSIWGILQLAVMALSFYYNSVALVDDLPLPKQVYTSADELRDDMATSYGQLAENCGIAILLYVLTFCISVHQLWVNSKRSSGTTYVRQYDMDMEEYS